MERDDPYADLHKPVQCSECLRAVAAEDISRWAGGDPLCGACDQGPTKRRERKAFEAGATVLRNALYEHMIRPPVAFDIEVEWRLYLNNRSSNA